MVNNYFADLVGTCTTTAVINLIPDLSDEFMEKFTILPPDSQRVTKLLERVRTNTATGPDDIPAFLIRKLAYYISPNITRLFNSSITNGIFPSQWKKANVVAIYKNKGAKSKVDNYRPISVLPVLGRVLEKVVGTQLQQFCNMNEIIPIQQFGFHKNSSCEMALLAAMDSWVKDVSNGKLVGALLIDLSKAFDSISHAHLIQELEDIDLSH